MLQILRKFTGTIIIFIVLLLFFFWWQNARSFDDSAMDNIPVYSDVDERSFLSNESYLSKLEPTYLRYYETKNQVVFMTLKVFILKFHLLITVL